MLGYSMTSCYYIYLYLQLIHQNKRKGSIMKNMKRFLAILGIVFFLGLYILALVAALVDFPYHKAILQACIFSIFYITLFIALFKAVYSFLKKKNENKNEAE